MKKYAAALCLVALFGAGQSALAADPELCLDCHEPAEDWEGMSTDEILAEAKNADIKRHADNLELSDEELQAIIFTLVEK